MIGSSEDEEEYDDREMEPYGKAEKKKIYEVSPDIIKTPLPQDPSAKANAIAAHWGGIKHALREEPIEEEVESEDGEQYAEREEEGEEEESEEGEQEGEAGGDESEEDSGYPLSQETARFNLQNMPMAQQIGMQMFAADREHMLPPRQSAPPAMQNTNYPTGFYPPGGYPPGAYPGHSMPPGFPVPGYPSYPGQYPAPYPAPYPEQFPAAVPRAPQPAHPPSVYQPQPHPSQEVPQPLKSGSHVSLGSQHSRSQTSILSQSQGSLVPSSRTPLGPEPQPLKPSAGSRGTASQSNFKTIRDAPTINGIPYTSAMMNFHQNHDYHALGPREDDDVGGFIDATAGKYPSKRHHHRHSKRHKKKHRKKHSSSSTSSSDQVVEIAHLSMDMLKHDKKREKYPTPSSQKIINVPSHNLNDQYKEKHDTVKANNLKNKHGYSDSVAVLSTTSSSPRMITHDQLFHNTDQAVQNNVENHQQDRHDSMQSNEQNEDRPFSVGSERQDNSRPNSAMSSASNRLLNRQQSSKSLLRQGSLNGQFIGNTGNRNTSRPSSAPSLPRSIPSESPRMRPQSAVSLNKPDNRASSPRKDAFGENSNHYRPESARSNRPVSARSIKSRPMSARSTKSQASGIDIIDNLSRRSSGHIMSNFKSNALKNQEQDAIIDEHGEINDDSGTSSDKNEKGGLLNNGSMPNLDEKSVENEISQAASHLDTVPQSSGSGADGTNKSEAIYENIDDPLGLNQNSINQNKMPANDGTDGKHESVYESLPEAGDALKSTPSGSEAAS